MTLELCSFLQSHWQPALTKLSSKLEENTSLSKWPELSFIAFLSMSVEVLRQSLNISQNRSISFASNCNQMIAEHLESLTNQVTRNCVLPISLKELLKVYDVLCRDSHAVSESIAVTIRKQLGCCLPKLFLSNSMVKDVVTAVIEDTGPNGMCDKTVQNLNKSIARKVILFLLKYASLLEDQGKKLS